MLSECVRSIAERGAKLLEEWRRRDRLRDR
jgi:hypothetical protein